MAKIVFSKPDPTDKTKTYHQFRPWLELNHYDKICGYCFLLDSQLHIDHYEPQDYAPKREKDPTNLVLSCSRCNSPSGKWYYHPQSKRLNSRNGESHYIHFIRDEDISKIFSMSKNGKINILAGQKQRGQWLVTLFDLNDPAYIIQRSFLFGSIKGATKLLNAGASPLRSRKLFNFLDHIARNMITVFAFDIKIDPIVKSALKTFVTATVNLPRKAKKKKNKISGLKGKSMHVNAKKKKRTWTARKN